ncbi:hypothetical protein A9Q86_00860 [Flavobacteriales bacterium 33_180_T64]|nr:hypothetical protein A9Q86_00860 [Flavobacteriales bacterium 33_180_T64]
MKKTILLLTLISLLSFNSYSQSMTKKQSRDHQSWFLSVGVNAVGSLGTQNPVEKLEEFEFSRPFAIAIQHKWTEHLSIEQDFTMNQFKVGSTIDNGVVTEKLNYYSTNTYLKYYFSDYLLKNVNWLDMYAGGGLGVFSIDEFNTSANLVLGGTIWINPNIGVRLQSVGKFAFNQKDNRYDNNHFQYMLQAVFKL